MRLDPAADDPGASDHAAASSRRLARLALDLHDGPLQGIAALAAELRLLRAQVDEAPPELVRGRIDDALDVVAAIESDVRDLAGSLESRRLVDLPFAELIETEARHAEADGVAVRVAVVGELDACTPSQRIALFRVVQESLWNIRQHSGAAAATISVTGDPDVLVAEIADDGRGFDVERAERVANESSRIGLRGMHERVRMLGGTLHVDSGSGGTTVRAEIPCWAPNDPGQPGTRSRDNA